MEQILELRPMSISILASKDPLRVPWPSPQFLLEELIKTLSPETTFVYRIFADDLKTVYIGIARNPFKRMRQHLDDAMVKLDESPLCRFIRAASKSLVMELLEWHRTRSEAERAESEWELRELKQGRRVLNRTMRIFPDPAV